MTWLRKKTIPGFAPRGDEVIGNTRQGQPVTISQEFWRWLSLLATRLQSNVEAPGTIQMTAAATEPEGWLFLNGQSVDANLYPDLEGIFGATAGIITLPDYSGRIAMGAGAIVDLNGTAGAETVTLTRNEMPKHNHGVSDPGHLHAAIDRGHSHDLQLDSHAHEVTEVEGQEHVHGITDPGHSHGITDPGHVHGDTADVTANNYVTDGSDRELAIDQNTGSATTGITVNSAATGITETDESTTDLSLVASDAEVTGAVSKSQADIRVHKARTGITTLDDGEGQPFSIIPPVFGVNYMVKT